MITLEAEERNLLIHVPESWDEMSPKQAHFCLKLAARMLAGELSEDMFRLKCFYKLADIKRSWRSVMWEKLVSEETLIQKNGNTWQLANLLTEFMFKPVESQEGEEGLKEFSFEALTNFFPKFKIGFKNYYGPDTLLADLSFSEFRVALEELNGYFESKDEMQLSRLFAVLYRPARTHLKQQQQLPDYDGKIKEIFNRNHQHKYAKELYKLPAWQRMAMLLHFTWSINYLKSEDIEIEGRKINFSPLFPKATSSGAKDKPSTGWTGVLFGIAEKGIFGNIKQTDEAGLFDVLLLLYDNYLQTEEIKRNSKSSKK